MKRQVLVVDDSSSLRQIVKNYLDKIPDLEIYEAGNGFEAEVLLQTASVMDVPIEVMVLDWMMPEQNGFELLQKLRSIPQFQNQPKVIMLTAETQVEHIEACLTLNVSAYLTKPFTQEELCKAVTAALAEVAQESKYAV